MEKAGLRKTLRALRDGRLSPAQAAERLASLSTADLGFARIDHQRLARRGLPEVVFGEGKTKDQLLRIFAHLSQRRSMALATRVAPTVGEELAARHPRGQWNSLARTFHLPRPGRRPRGIPGLLVVSAGTADLPVAEEAAASAEALGLACERLYDVGVAGLHRLLEASDQLRRARVIVVVAGMEGALPSVVAGLVEAPVIGVPTSVGYGAALGGLTPLFGMLTSCAGGVLVVNIDNGFGAACAARLILATGGRRVACRTRKTGRPFNG